MKEVNEARKLGGEDKRGSGRGVGVTTDVEEVWESVGNVGVSEGCEG